MADYFLIDNDGDRDGPYSEEDLLDMIDADELSAGAVCEDSSTGRRMRVRELFRVIKPAPEPASETHAPVPKLTKRPGPEAAEEDDEEKMTAPPRARSRSRPSSSDSPRKNADEEEDEHEKEDDGYGDNEEPEAMPAPPPKRWSPAPLPEEGPMATLRPVAARICYAGYPSLLVYWRGLGFSAACFAAGWYLGRFEGPWLTCGLMAGMLSSMLTLLLRSRTEHLITTRHVEVRTGLLSKSSREVRLLDIRSINVRKSGLTGLLGVGTVEFSSSAGEEDDVVFQNAAGAHGLKELVRRLQDKAR